MGTAANIDVTVVIPTYNRRQLLAGAVASLREQTHPADRYEVLVVSDGSTDGTDGDYATPLTSPTVRLVRRERRGYGIGAARNLGLGQARGALVLFFDDDMVADPGLVAAHVRARSRIGDRVGVCGRVEADPGLPDTPFCRIVIGDVCRRYEEDGSARFISFDHALSWQTSFDREALAELGGYDERFQSYGWEDIELSFRAARRGWRFYYEPAALSLHRDQSATLALHAERLRAASESAAALLARHPDLRESLPMYDDKGPIDWRSDGAALAARKAVRRLLATAPLRAFMERMTPLVERAVPSPALLRRWYYGLLGSYVLLGYREGLRRLDPPRPDVDRNDTG